MHWLNDSGKCTLHFTSYFTGKLDSFWLPYWKDFLKQGRLDRTIASQCQSSLWLFFQQVLQDLITKNPSNTASMIQTTWTMPWSTKEQSSTSPKASNLGELDSRMDWAIESQYQSSPWFFSQWVCLITWAILKPLTQWFRQLKTSHHISLLAST